MAGPKLEYQVYIRTTPDKLWEAITKPENTRQYFYGLAVKSDWKTGSSVQHQSPDGQAVLDGKVIEVNRGKKLVTTLRPASRIALPVLRGTSRPWAKSACLL